MRQLCLAGLALAMFVSSPQRCQAGLLDWLYEPNIKVKNVEEIRKAAHDVIEKARKEMDGLLKDALAGERAVIMDSLDKADGIIQGAITKTFAEAKVFKDEVFRDLIKQQEFFFRNLDIRLVELRSTAITITGTLDGTVQDAIHQITRDLERSILFGGSDLTSLSRRRVLYQPSGEYRFEAVGKAFGIGPGSANFTFGLRSGEVKASSLGLMQDSVQEFSIEAKYLNPEFADILPSPVRVEVVAAKKKWVARKGGEDERPLIVLAPKFPVEFSLVETTRDGRKRNLKPLLWNHLLKAEGAEIEDGFGRFLRKESDVSSIRGIDGYFAVRKATLPQNDEQLAKLRDLFQKNPKERDLAVNLAKAARFGTLGKLSEHRLPLNESEFELAADSTWKFSFSWYVGGADGSFRGPDKAENITVVETREADGRRILTVKVGAVPVTKN